ncbi:MAG: hypothetical protein R2727_03420 [Bacteroidales bacterium]
MEKATPTLLPAFLFVVMYGILGQRDFVFNQNDFTGDYLVRLTTIRRF